MGWRHKEVKVTQLESARGIQSHSAPILLRISRHWLSLLEVRGFEGPGKISSKNWSSFMPKIKDSAFTLSSELHLNPLPLPPHVSLDVYFRLTVRLEKTQHEFSGQMT